MKNLTVGEMVRLKNIAPQWNGMQAKIVKIEDREFTVVPVRFDRELLVYRNELEPW